MKALALAAAIVVCLPSIALPGQEMRIHFVATPFGVDEVRLTAEGACGSACGIVVQWVVYRESGMRRWWSGRGIVVFPLVVRGENMLAVAEVRDYTGAVIGRGGCRFLYDGAIHRLPPRTD